MMPSLAKSPVAPPRVLSKFLFFVYFCFNDHKEFPRTPRSNPKSALLGPLRVMNIVDI